MPPAALDPLDTLRFASSWLVSPVVLFSLRLLFSLYAFATRLTVIGFDAKVSAAEAGHDFSYFTDLTYWGLAFYFAFAALHTGSYAFSRAHRPLLARWPAALQQLHRVFYATVTVFPFIVTIVYWALLYTPPFASAEAAWSNISQHGLNSAFAVFEIVVPRTPAHPWLALPVLVLLLACYLAVAYITYARSHFFVYGFLNFHRHSAGVVAGYVVGILVACVVLFALSKYAITLRVWLTEEKAGLRGKLYRDGLEEDAEEVGEYAPSKEARSSV